MTSAAAEPLIDRDGSPSRAFRPSQVFSPYDIKAASTTQDGEPEEPSSDEVMFVIRSSVWINGFLFIIKVYAFVCSGSLSVLASVVDSAIDLVGQGVLMYTKKLAEGDAHGDYPVGRDKLEPVGVMICAVVMGMASVEVIDTSAMRIMKFWGSAEVPEVKFDIVTALLLAGVVVLKFVLYIWCSRVQARNNDDDAVKAIAQDNLNDVYSNIVALFAAGITSYRKTVWIIDPVGGILISLYIIYSWMITGMEQVEMIVGKSADPEFLETIQDLCNSHHKDIKLDKVNAYHFGPKYLVEVEVVMPETTVLKVSHDIGVSLQHKIEELDDVQRCFVHVDYQMRLHDDHNPKVPLFEKLHGANPGLPKSPSEAMGDKSLV